MDRDCEGSDHEKGRSRKAVKPFRDINDYYNDDSTLRSSRRKHVHKSRPREKKDSSTHPNIERRQFHTLVVDVDDDDTSVRHDDEDDDIFMRDKGRRHGDEKHSSSRHHRHHHHNHHRRGPEYEVTRRSTPSSNSPYHYWSMRPWRHLDSYEDRARRRVLHTSADCSEFISLLPPRAVLPLTSNSSWFFNREITLAARRQGKIVLIDCLDLAMSYGERWGEIDFAGINVAVNSFIADEMNPPWKLVIFEHEWDWWRRRKRRTWEEESRFLEEIVKTRLIEILPSGPTYNTDTQILYCVYDDETNRPLWPREALKKNIGNSLTDIEDFTVDQIAAACGLYLSKTGRTLGQTCSLIEYTMRHQGVLLCNDAKLFPHVGLINPELFRYICKNKQLYTFLSQRLIIQQDTLLNTHRALNLTVNGVQKS